MGFSFPSLQREHLGLCESGWEHAQCRWKGIYLTTLSTRLMSSPRTEEMLCLSPLTSQTKVHLLGRTQEHLQLQLRHSPWVLSRAEASHKLGNCSSFSRFLSKGKKEYYHSDFLDYSVCLLLPTLVTTGLFFKLQSALPKSKYLLLKH